ncbi:electron transfer flavoprotein subunit beta [Spartinivicinus ruber]|uniref:electron transfer flavoprotein subunit beta n=1 Tax=Spartinivicinus ruber TaxID=2683272 RepID=UPI0013D0BF64|nr:electron transfer flavoprotein subunit beta [Spartinivicinus ruber]
MQPNTQQKPNNNGIAKITTLVSIGLHPKSQRGRRADQDAKALELALNLVPEQLEVLHAGNPRESVLRQYLGMGVDQVTVLDQPYEADAIPALIEYLSENKADIIFTGTKAEQGESSGMTPYLIAEQLKLPMVPNVAAIKSINGRIAEILQALPRGQRRLIKVQIPFVASIDTAAAAPRQSAFGKAKRGVINDQDATISIDEVRASWNAYPAKKRPKRLKVMKAKTAADRFKAATASSKNEGGSVIENKSPAEAAKAIYDLLVAEKVVK